MLEISLINSSSVFLINAFGLWLAFWVYSSNSKNIINRLFIFWIVLMLLNIDLGFFSNKENLIQYSLILKRLRFGAVSLFFIVAYFLFTFFIERISKRMYLDKIYSFVWIILFYVSVFTDLIINKIKIREWGIDIVFGKGILIYYLVTSFSVVILLYILIRKYYIFPNTDKIKIQYFLVGVVIYAIFNLNFNIILPILSGTMHYYELGDYSAIFLIVFTAYAIVKHELMGIKTLLTQALIITISIILLVDLLFLSENPTMQLLKLGILLAFLYFSREMVKSVKKEKESREALEKINIHLKEKTQDLESLSSLNEMVSSTTEIEKSVQNIMDAVPDKLGHLGIMGTFLIRYDEKRRKVYAYITTESEKMEAAKKLLVRPKLSDYSLCIDAKHLKSCGLIIKSILSNEIEKGSNLVDFISPPVDKSTALKIQKNLGGKTFVSVPMTIRGKKKGALVFIFTKAISEVSSRDLDLIKAFTQHVSVVMDNLHFYHHLNENIEELTRAKDKLKEMLEMKNDFLHIVSHQLRTPLTAMRGFISMWSEGDFDSLPKDKMEEIKTRIVNNSERLNNIVNDMVTAMESEGELKVEFKLVNIGKIMAGIIEMLKPNFEKKNLYLKYKEVTKNIPRIEADEKLLLNVFMNLVDNSEKYTDTGGLTIAVVHDAENVKIEFIDTGIGLSKDDKKILFKKFSRGAKSNYINPNGSGLGLFIIKQIITKHRGKIKAFSKGGGKGSTFTIVLPISQGR